MIPLLSDTFDTLYSPSFHVISISLIPDGDYTCAHCFLGRLPLCTRLLCSMTHYDITMGNDVAREAHCNITMGNGVVRDIHCDVTMSNDVAMHNNLCMNLFCYVLGLFHIWK